MTGITLRSGIERVRRPVAVLFGLILFLGAARIWPAEEEGTPGFVLSAGAGIFRAEQASFRTLYGNSPFVFSVDLRARLFEGLWAVAGWRTMKSGGRTAVAGQAFDEESYALEFEMTSFRLGLRYAREFGRFVPFVGAGGSANRYEERWTDVAGLGGNGKEMGWYVEMGAEYGLAPFLFVFLRGEYSSVRTGRGSVLEPDVDLGGWEASAGLAFRF